MEERAPVVLRAADLRALPRSSQRSAMQHGAGVFRGPSLDDVFKLAGVPVDSVHGPRLAQYALFDAKDGYRAVIGLSELSPEISGQRIRLADELNGKPLDSTAAP